MVSHFSGTDCISSLFLFNSEWFLLPKQGAGYFCNYSLSFALIYSRYREDRHQGLSSCCPVSFRSLTSCQRMVGKYPWMIHLTLPASCFWGNYQAIISLKMTSCWAAMRLRLYICMSRTGFNCERNWYPITLKFYLAQGTFRLGTFAKKCQESSWCSWGWISVLDKCAAGLLGMERDFRYKKRDCGPVFRRCIALRIEAIKCQFRLLIVIGGIWNS